MPALGDWNWMFCLGGIFLAVGCAFVFDVARGRRHRESLPVGLAEREKAS